MDNSSLTRLFDRIDRGDAEAEAALFPLVYEELRRMAAARMASEPAGHTLQPTALVHEAWMRLGADAQPKWQSRGHFFGAAAESMRRILIDNARRRQAARRGRGERPLRLDATGFDVAVEETTDDQLILLNDALEALAQQDPRRADLVKQRYFIGLTFAEVAELTGRSLRTVKGDWSYARAWLVSKMRELSEEGKPPPAGRT